MLYMSLIGDRLIQYYLLCDCVCSAATYGLICVPLSGADSYPEVKRYDMVMIIR